MNSLLTEKQARTIQEFRESVADILQPHHDDHYLRRWLVARDYDLKKAENMIRCNTEWRKQHKMDTFYEEWKPPEVLIQYFAGGLTGFDKEGFPVFIMPTGKLDMTGLTLSAKRHDIVMYNVYQVEQCYRVLQEQSEKVGQRIDQVIMISDMDGFTLKLLFSHGMDVLLKALQVVEDNYPETLKKCYVINASSIFPLVFNMCKPFLSEETKKKVIILGKDWREKLLEAIDADQLPQHWAGSDCGPDGNDKYCTHKICMGGTVPSSYNLKGLLIDQEKWTKQEVKAGGTLTLQYTVTQPNTVLKWHFQTNNHDIGFGLDFQENDCEKHTTIIPVKRHPCHRIPEEGAHECQQFGTYVVKFDNSFSWMNSKKLSYFIETVLTEDFIEETVHRVKDDGTTDKS